MVKFGRHASLRGWCSQGRAGSSPVLGTFFKWLKVVDIFSHFVLVRSDLGEGVTE